MGAASAAPLLPDAAPLDVTEDMLQGEIAYLRNILRSRYDATLHDDLLEAGLVKLAYALHRPTRPGKRSAYLRCAMHSGIMDAFRSYLQRRARMPTVSLEEWEDEVTSPGPEDVLLTCEGETLPESNSASVVLPRADRPVPRRWVLRDDRWQRWPAP